MFTTEEREQLYEVEDLDLEEWLDKIEDCGIWEMKEGDEKEPKRKTGASVMCKKVSSSKSDDITVKRCEYEMKISNGDVIQMIYLLDYYFDDDDDDEGDLVEKTAYYNDEDGNENPCQNCHWDKWQKAFNSGLKS